MISMGIDPGTNGAIALFWPASMAVHSIRGIEPGTPDGVIVWDIPTNEITVGGKKRKRIDMLGLGELLDIIMDLYAPEKIAVEKVSAMPGQSGMFEFGFTVGAIHQALVERDMPFTLVTPTQWKKELKAPKDKKECVAKCDALWPTHRALFRTSTGREGLRPDRAEAALLAYWISGAWK